MKLKEQLVRFFERPLAAGTIVAERYKIESVLGMGSYGITYCVLDLLQQKMKVLKQLRRSKQIAKTGALSFQYERRILQKLHHPCIPQCMDFFQWDNLWFLVMELIEGKNYEQLIFQNGQSFSEREGFLIVQDILTTVSYFHRQGIVHRDLRIPNIILHNEKNCVLDFGLARFIGEQDERSHTFKGEKQLMREVHVRSDFYALGHFLLFVLYSGYVPTTKKERPWFEELSLSAAGQLILKRMLQIEQPYAKAEDILQDINRII
ncbi:protein kinase [Bacillus sp. 165]|uniref:serine/threonine protein kinase n=1 Tax=Bacillus sp. 165 TaxID=1529117 RepID=UPI001ADD5A58|nr:protein kinase [Bacillus sp. 165]MBO9129297.1 protein kinase [Bacillus sp. 165]